MTSSFVHILVEGQTEETFVRDVLAPYLAQRNLYLTARLAATKTVMSGTQYKGGLNRYQPVKADLKRLLGDTNAAAVTTMIDYYGLPKDFPGQNARPQGSCFEQVEHLERAFWSDIGHRRFLPYLSLHEFEALLFVSPEEIARQFPGTQQVSALTSIRREFDSPEEINNHPETAPSKRLAALFPGYRKTLHGALISRRIGVERMRAECRHFDSWLQRLQQLCEGE